MGRHGAFAMLAGSVMIFRAIVRSSARVLGMTAFGVWAAGVTVTTSYPHQAPLWLFLGLLLEWDRVFPPAGPERPHSDPGTAKVAAP
jgi:hypothetical protein